MNEKVNKIFAFLDKHHAWNDAFQIEEYKKTLTHCEDARSRLRALMHMIVNTQSKPKLEPLAKFWQRFEEHRWEKNGPSLSELINFFEEGKPPKSKTGPWDHLFQVIKAQKGWGPKTAALFVKCVIKIHRSTQDNLHFLSDISVAQKPIEADRIYLPVDAVIIHIFKNISTEGRSDFRSINSYLQKQKYTAEQMLTWDDLWFWGFFTQNSKGGSRNGTKWNAAKYWSQLSAPKSKIKIKEVEALCVKFIALLPSS